MRALIPTLPLLLLAACHRVATEPPPYVAPPTDTTPIGGGLSVIGLGIVVAAVVIALGDALRGSGKGGERDG